MSNGQATQEAQGAAADKASLPDINAETYPFNYVLKLLDQAAFLNAYSVPDPEAENPVIPAGGGGGAVGFQASERLHRFEVDLEPVSVSSGVRARNTAGQVVGSFNQRWLLMPDSFDAAPDREPPPTPLDLARSQRFGLYDGVCRFGSGADGFRGFGTGRTYPYQAHGSPRLMAAAVGTIVEGFGKFKGLSGTYTYNGNLDPGSGFVGNLVFRIMDPEGAIRRNHRQMPPLRPVPNPDPETTYIVFHGQKKNEEVKTHYTFKPSGEMEGFKLEQQVYQYRLRFGILGHRGLSSQTKLEGVIGRMTSQVYLNLLAPTAPGTDLDPIPFGSRNEFFFEDGEGKTVGSFVASQGEGRTFVAQLPGAPGQQALRFGAFQTLGEGTGCFSGVRGLLTDNSIVGVAPHVTTTLYIARLNDPDGAFRSALDR